jgi:hypothetical protein
MNDVKPGIVWVGSELSRGSYRYCESCREIRRGKDKGKWKVVLSAIPSRTIKVDFDQIKRMPPKKQTQEPLPLSEGPEAVYE